MNHSLYCKFILGYLMFGLLRFIAIITVSSRMTYDHPMEEKAEMLYDETNLTASNYSTVYQGKSIDVASTYPQLKTVAAFTQTEIWMVGHKGTTVVDSNHPNKVGTTIQDFSPTSIDNKSYCVGSYHDRFPGEMLSVSAPITGNYNTYGYMIIRLPLSQVTAAQNGILNILYVPAGIIFALSLIILLMFAQAVYTPLKEITAAANQYAERNLKYRTELRTHDEMGYLAAALDYMPDGPNQMEEYQHTFIANVSHDFCSPLTSTKGCLEAILDGIIPPEMYEKYLTRVITKTERLNKLTQSMLTLNSFNSRGYLSWTSFDINRVIKDTTASFEGTCEDKNIMLDLTFSGGIQIVCADMGKIQQMLYNLIDNAIKFSHHDFTIYIRTSIKNEKIFVFVEDTRIGIPKPNQKKVWGRFYKSDLSRGRDKKGAGLDLAIVKEITQSHDGNISCISTGGVGTEFIFSLPRSTNL